MSERNEKAVVRRDLEEFDYVSRTWIEWSLSDGEQLKTLVVEVNIDTDPNATSSDIRGALQNIDAIIKGAKTTMSIHFVKVVPKSVVG